MQLLFRNTYFIIYVYVIQIYQIDVLLYIFLYAFYKEQLNRLHFHNALKNQAFRHWYTPRAYHDRKA